MNYYGNAVKHVNSWYVIQDRSIVLPHNVVVSEFGYAIPQRAAEWLQEQTERYDGLTQSMTIEGISHVLTSHWDDREGVSVTDAIALYQQAVEEASEKGKINMDAPNQYLWQYVDRYLDTPVGHSQYVYETDSVPFLEMVLHGTMETYAPYANFSFYTQADILKMIDYNLSPSFILSEAPSYELAATSSSYLYSTEYDLYQDVIPEIYGQINEVLSQVQGYRWTGRQVLQEGVILNVYEKDQDVRKVLINYTEEVYSGTEGTVAPESAMVLK